MTSGNWRHAASDGLPALLLASGLALLATHLWFTRPSLDDVLPAPVYEYNVDLGFEGFGGDVRLAMFLPDSDERQALLEEQFDSATLPFEDRSIQT